jgi:hypothetical protein
MERMLGYAILLLSRKKKMYTRGIDARFQPEIC